MFGKWAASELGWNHYRGSCPSISIVSRYEIKKEFFYLKRYGLGVKLEDDKGRPLHIFSIWMHWAKDVGGYLKKYPNASDAELLACEGKRLKETATATKINNCSWENASK